MCVYSKIGNGIGHRVHPKIADECPPYDPGIFSDARKVYSIIVTIRNKVLCLVNKTVKKDIKGTVSQDGFGF